MKKTFIKPQVSAQTLETAALMQSSSVGVKETTITSEIISSGAFTAAGKRGSSFHDQDILLDI